MNSPARPVTVLPKPEVLSALFASWDDIDRLVAPISEDQWRTPSALPGWTVHSLVAHMVGTESMLLGKPNPDAGVDTFPWDASELRERRTMLDLIFLALGIGSFALFGAYAFLCGRL